VADRVDADVEPVQPSRHDAALYGSAADAKFPQLAMCHDAVLAVGDPGDLPVTWSI